jgi:hypothetical protein
MIAAFCIVSGLLAFFWLCGARMPRENAEGAGRQASDGRASGGAIGWGARAFEDGHSRTGAGCGAELAAALGAFAVLVAAVEIVVAVAGLFTSEDDADIKC